METAHQARPLRIGSVPALLYGGGRERAYLYVHGKSGCKEEAADFAAIACPKGFSALSFDLPGHGERKGEPGFDPWHAVPEIRAAMAYLRERYASVMLYCSSIGAWFSMLALIDAPPPKCLFVSPILDMERLIQNMMRWADVSEARLRQEGEIETPFGETLSWEYLTYARTHRIAAWRAPTAILYAGRDNLTERETVDAFTKEFGCDLTVFAEGEHWFHTPEQLRVLRAWTERFV